MAKTATDWMLRKVPKLRLQCVECDKALGAMGDSATPESFDRIEALFRQGHQGDGHTIIRTETWGEK
jgi:hypothetical protein